MFLHAAKPALCRPRGASHAKVVLALAVAVAATAAACDRKAARRGALGVVGAQDGATGAGPASAAGPPEAAASASVSTPPEAAASSAASASASAAAAPGADSCDVVDRDLRRAMPRRIVALGDVHGDVHALSAALRAAGAIDKEGGWIGGDLVVVQTGDLLDRGDHEQAIIDWLEQLETQAQAAGGALWWLLGNHELMNAAGDLRYVTAGGFRDFDDVAGLPLGAFSSVPAYARARVAAFAPGVGPYAKVLAGQDTVIVVGDTVFSHAGVTDAWASRLPEVNRDNRCYLAGRGEVPAALTDMSSPVWTRDWGFDDVDCASLARALAAIGAKRMVVGHTTQPSGISSRCDQTLWRIDVGLGAAYGGPIEVLEIDAKGARKITGTR
jgi:hypothetical protein